MGMGVGKPAPEIRSLITQTLDDLTLYVRTTGNDSNSGLSEDKALLTIQAAIDKVPRYIRHDVFIDIGVGTFGAVDINSFTITETGTFEIEGVLGRPTLTTGAATGTITSVTFSDPGIGFSTIVDTNQTWTTNELAGMIFHNTVTENYGYIVENTTNSIVVCDYNYSLGANGNSYEILEHQTIIQGQGSLGKACVEVLHCSSLTTDGIVLRNLCAAPAQATIAGFLFYNSLSLGEFLYTTSGSGGAATYYGFAMGLAGLPCRLKYCHADFSYLGGYVMFRTGGTYATNEQGEDLLFRCSAANHPVNSCTGVVIEQATGATIGEFCGYNLGVGFVINSSNVYINHSHIYGAHYCGIMVDIKTAAEWYFYGDSVVSLDFVYLNEFSDGLSSFSGILAGGRSTVYCRTVTGTGASGSGFGADVRDGAEIIYAHSGTNTVTGDEGDLTVNKGVSVHSWTDIDNPGDAIINLDEGSKAKYRHVDPF